MKLQPIEREKKKTCKNTAAVNTSRLPEKKRKLLSQSDPYGQDDINKKNQYNSC